MMPFELNKEKISITADFESDWQNLHISGR
jgi:hypothetical protein